MQAHPKNNLMLTFVYANIHNFFFNISKHLKFKNFSVTDESYELLWRPRWHWKVILKWMLKKSGVKILTVFLHVKLEFIGPFLFHES
jgi:hypothetical protein